MRVGTYLNMHPGSHLITESAINLIKWSLPGLFNLSIKFDQHNTASCSCTRNDNRHTLTSEIVQAIKRVQENIED